MDNHFLEQPLYEFFSSLWLAETSSSPYWLADNPSMGQSVPTSLIIQDYMGGDIMRGVVQLESGRTDSHYWNMIGPDRLDVTGYQYGPFISSITLKEPLLIPVREYLLENPDVQRRYDLLQQQIKGQNIERFFRFLKPSPIAL